MDILVVDDDGAVASLLVDSLVQEGHTATVTPTVAEALEYLSHHTVDAILLDLMLPDDSGIEVLRDVRRRALQTPVLVFTGHADSPEADEARALGAVDVMQKPQILDNLAAALRNLRKPR